MAVLVLTVSVRAAQTGSILIHTCGGAVALYRVGGINGQSFLLDEAFGGGMVTVEDSFSPNLAAWLAGQAKTGVVKTPDMQGKVLFSELEPGLYLLSQPSAPAGAIPFEPFLVSIPWDGALWNVGVDPVLPEPLPVTEDPARPVPWFVGMAMSALGLFVCLRQGSRAYIR